MSFSSSEVSELLEGKGNGSALVDLSSKPPGTNRPPALMRTSVQSTARQKIIALTHKTVKAKTSTKNPASKTSAIYLPHRHVSPLANNNVVHPGLYPKRLVQSRHTTSRFRVQPQLISPCNMPPFHAAALRTIALSECSKSRIGSGLPCAPMRAHRHA